MIVESRVLSKECIKGKCRRMTCPILLFIPVFLFASPICGRLLSLYFELRKKAQMGAYTRRNVRVLAFISETARTQFCELVANARNSSFFFIYINQEW